MTLRIGSRSINLINLVSIRQALKRLNPLREMFEPKDPTVPGILAPKPDRASRTVERYRVRRNRKNQIAAMSRRRNRG